ncbi:MAG TPA: cobalamin-dependent protein, partial [bacterium]|nr:cobalamin-dependent protein [bacterium]
MRVLLVNPSHAGQGNIPVNLPILAAVLRRAGHDVRVFDFTNYEVFQPGMQRVDRTRDTAVPSDKFARPDYHFKQAPPPDLRAIANERRSYARRLGLADRLDPGRLLWDSDPSRDFEQLLDTFLPAVVGITCLTVDLDHAVAFIEPFRRLHDFRVVIGGVHARAVPESLVDIECVDAICIGDGESAFPEYVNRLTRGERLDSIPNMWVRTPDGWALNDDTWRTEMSDLPVPDFDGFDPVHFYRPFNGQLYRMLNYEWNRGCPYSCSFCMNS